jgi:hypothetical protein
VQRNNPILHKPSDPAEPIKEVDVEEKKNTVAGMRLDSDDKDASYHGLFPMRQLWRPNIHFGMTIGMVGKYSSKQQVEERNKEGSVKRALRVISY